MALHFTREELAERRARTVKEIQAAGLDGLLIFRQESMYYLTGYDTFGFVFFQCLYLGAEGRMMLLTRSADRRQAQQTSVIEDIRIWVDRDGASPASELKAILDEFGLPREDARHRVGGLWPHRPQRPPPHGCARRLLPS